MVAADHDRGFKLAALDELVHGDAKLGPFTVAEPANPRGQALKMNSVARELHPARQSFVLREKIECQFIGARDVGGIAAGRDPAKRPFSFAEKRADVFGHESGNIESLFDARL